MFSLLFVCLFICLLACLFVCLFMLFKYFTRSFIVIKRHAASNKLGASCVVNHKCRLKNQTFIWNKTFSRFSRNEFNCRQLLS